MPRKYKGERRFTGAQIPAELWVLMDREARRQHSSKSHVIAVALAERYDRPDLHPDAWAKAAQERAQQEELPMTG